MSKNSGLRITGGAWRGRRVKVPASARPTTERVREAIWGRWQGLVEGARMLELYAGSGAMCLEALSRGAVSCVAVERSVPALRLLQENASRLGGEIETVKASMPGEWAAVARHLRAPIDLVFLDPPYRDGVSVRLLGNLAPVLASDGRIAVEHPRRLDLQLPESLGVEETRRYGETAVTYLIKR